MSKLSQSLHVIEYKSSCAQQDSLLWTRCICIMKVKITVQRITRSIQVQRELAWWTNFVHIHEREAYIDMLSPPKPLKSYFVDCLYEDVSSTCFPHNAHTPLLYAHFWQYLASCKGALHIVHLDEYGVQRLDLLRIWICTNTTKLDMSKTNSTIICHIYLISRIESRSTHEYTQCTCLKFKTSTNYQEQPGSSRFKQRTLFSFTVRPLDTFPSLSLLSGRHFSAAATFESFFSHLEQTMKLINVQCTNVQFHSDQTNATGVIL